MYACYRFTTKLRTYGDMLARCIDSVTANLHAAIPGMGENSAIDGSDLAAYANGQRHLFDGGPERTRFSDPDASWGHRSAVSTRSHGGFYGYKLDMAVCTATDLPLAWNVRTARNNESLYALPLLDQVASGASRPGRAPWIAATTSPRSMTAARSATPARSSRFARPPT